MFAFGAAGSKLFHGLGSWQEVLTQDQAKLVDDAPSAEIFSSFYVHEYFSLHHAKIHEDCALLPEPVLQVAPATSRRARRRLPSKLVEMLPGCSTYLADRFAH